MFSTSKETSEELSGGQRLAERPGLVPLLCGYAPVLLGGDRSRSPYIADPEGLF